jgi:prolyl-tRNA synthetase
MRFSKSFIPTTKEAPKDAVLPSHIYLSRAGFVSQVSSGVYNFLPLGKMTLDKIRQVVKEELDKAGAQEVSLGFVTPADLWRESGRFEKFGNELLRFKYRKEQDYVLGPTHEEMMVNLVRNRVTSYKQLPLNLYQINLKFRDEARPRFGLMRGREFLMKDGYSFHASTEDMQREFALMEQTYKNILERLGLDYRVVEADSGAIGGSGSKELMVIAGSGEDTIVLCDSCEYAANVEAAVCAPKPAPQNSPSKSFAKEHTPAVKTMEELQNFFSIDPYYLMKAVAKKALFDESEAIVLFFLRGDDELQEVKAANSVGANELVDVDEEELKAARMVPGFMGPLDQDVQMVFDASLEGATDMVCGANEVDYHYVGMAMDQVNEAQFHDLVTVNAGDTCAHCGSSLSEAKGIEVGHIFQLGDVYSKPLEATFLDENGKQQPFVMGTYGIGVSRLVAAVIEQNHDEKGCIWTPSTAPYLVNIMVSNIKDADQMALGESLYSKLNSQGVDVIIDDRKERFGFKMKDAELIGFPYTVIIGKELANGNVQIFERKSGEKIDVAVENIEEKLNELIA